MEVETLNLNEAATLLKMTPSSLRKKAKTGLVPGAKLGRDWIFIKEDLVNHLRLRYHSDVRQPLLNEREAQWQERKNFFKEATFGGIDLPILALESKFAEVQAKLKKTKPSKY